MPPAKAIGKGYAATGINSAIFRQSSLVTCDNIQYAAFYDGSGMMMLAMRTLGASDWETRATQYCGFVRDIHNVISLGVDGKGVLHVAWDHHNDPLNYCRSVAPGSLELTEPLVMTGAERAVTYPQFYSLPNGDLLFVYRIGRASVGDLRMIRYDVWSEQWIALPDPVIAGETERSPYWQMAVDPRSGSIHLSWCWRECEGNANLVTNHDICYARSDDGGMTWVRSTGQPYLMPIALRNAEPACLVPQDTNLANMTSMAVDSRGRPYIAGYWRPEDEPTEQVFLIFHDGRNWHQRRIGHRLGRPLAVGEDGGFTLSRPLVVLDHNDRVHVVLRDAELGQDISIASSRDSHLRTWTLQHLESGPVGDWEPTHDGVLWNRDNVLNMLIQKCQVGFPTPATPEPEPESVWVIRWRPGEGSSK